MSDSEDGLNLFDETASAAGNFPTALRGYDRNAVDDYVRALEGRVVGNGHQQSALETRVRQLETQLDEARRELETRPTGDIDYSSLGGRASNILRLAEEQARDMIEKATTDAKVVRDSAAREAESVRSSAQSEGAQIKTSGADEIARLREQGAVDVKAQIERARTEAAALVAAAHREADAVRREAAQQADTARQEAYLEGEGQRRAAETEAAGIRRSIAEERESAIAELRRIHTESVAATGQLLAEATQHHQEAGARLSEDLEKATALRADAETEAEQTRLRAIEESDTLLTDAKKQAARLRQRTQAEFEWRKEQLRRETENLEQRKQAILSQLAGLSDLASQSTARMPDLEPVSDPADLDGFATIDPAAEHGAGAEGSEVEDVASDTDTDEQAGAPADATEHEAAAEVEPDQPRGAGPSAEAVAEVEDADSDATQAAPVPADDATRQIPAVRTGRR